MQYNSISIHLNKILKRYEAQGLFLKYLTKKAGQRSLARQSRHPLSRQITTYFASTPDVLAAQGISGSIMFFRPSDAAQDLIVPISPSKEAHQVVDVSSLGKGM